MIRVGDPCRSSVLTVKETHHKYGFAQSHGEPRFSRSWRGGRAGYGAVSSFLVDFNILSKTVAKAVT